MFFIVPYGPLFVLLSFTNDHGYVPLVVNSSRSFPHSRLITGFVTRLTRRVPLVEKELLILPEHQSSPPVFSGVRVTRSLDLYACFVDRCLSFVLFSLAIVLSVLRYTNSDCLLWYLQTLLWAMALSVPPFMASCYALGIIKLSPETDLKYVKEFRFTTYK